MNLALDIIKMIRVLLHHLDNLVSKHYVIPVAKQNKKRILNTQTFTLNVPLINRHILTMTILPPSFLLSDCAVELQPRIEVLLKSPFIYYYFVLSSLVHGLISMHFKQLTAGPQCSQLCQHQSCLVCHLH